MRILALADVRKFDIQVVACPWPNRNEVLLRVAAVGICGTDFHIYDGLANYHLGPEASPIPLTDQPQVLGHEISGFVERVGDGVTRCSPGDLVIVDQVLNCHSQKRDEICEYCASGDSHQCSFGKEYGITGLAGAFSEFVIVPEQNVVPAREGTSPLEAALSEPLGCVIHAQDRVDISQARYGWDGERRIRHIAILGAGPSGLLFLQYLRQQRRFDGELFVLDVKSAKLRLARRLGGTPIDVGRVEDVRGAIQRATCGDGVQYLIEATGNGKAFSWIGKIACRQATLSLYGAGHGDLAPGCLTPLQSMELSVVTSAGASGRFDSDRGPDIYRRALRLIEDRIIDVACMATHRYDSLEEVPLAFSNHRCEDDFIKGVFVPAASKRAKERL